MNKIRKMMLIVLSIITIFLLSGCKNTFIAENIIYKGNEQKGYEIVGLLDKEKYIIIPNVYKEQYIKIKKSDYKNKFFKMFNLLSTERVYISNSHKYLEGVINTKSSSGKIMMLTTDSKVLYEKMYLEQKQSNIYNIYLCSKTYYEYESYRGYSNDNIFKIYQSEGFKPANLSYMYNYNESPNNGYYFIDDYDNELISYIPENPIRNGYIFKGWYKEAECINKWDFENDIIPEKKYINKVYSGGYIYKVEYKYSETKLYAKWV